MNLIALALGCVSACTSASGEIRGGGDRPGYDAAAPEPLAVPIKEDPFLGAGKTTWKGVYRDFFGRRAKSGCGAQPTCHSVAGRARTRHDRRDRQEREREHRTEQHGLRIRT